jgi:hypothetical protein
VPPTKLCSGIGPGGRRAVEFHVEGLKALYRLAQIADKLNISIEWLLWRSNVIDVIEMAE